MGKYNYRLNNYFFSKAIYNVSTGRFRQRRHFVFIYLC